MITNDSQNPPAVQARTRRPLSKKLRFEIFKRDGFTCSYCGRHPPAVMLEVDHIIPVAGGGACNSDNLTTSCFDCNRGKSDRSLSAIPESLSEKSARIKEAEAQLVSYYEVMEIKREREESDGWRVANILLKRFGKDSIPHTNFTTILNFNRRLGLYETMEAAEIAAGKMRNFNSGFRYFCGICWRLITELEASQA